MEGVRIDKWLWVVRVFKTRTMATEACRAGKVSVNGHEVKPSKEVKINDTITVKVNPHFTRTLLVLDISENRVSASRVSLLAQELTPSEEYEKLKLYREFQGEWRPRGAGRPTKKERRIIQRFKDPDQ